MADWIKVRHELVRSPKLWQFARQMNTQKYTALGVAIAWFVWLDEQTTDGNTELSADEVDDVLGFRGAAAALVRIGWASIGGDGTVIATDFDKHNSESAKKRADTALRVARYARRKKANAETNAENVSDVTESGYQTNAANVSNELENALPRIRVDKKETLSYESAKKEAPTLDEVILIMSGLLLGNLKGNALTECATRFLDDNEAAGWMDTKSRPIQDWKAAARNYARRYAENMAKGNTRPTGGNRRDCNNADDYR